MKPGLQTTVQDDGRKGYESLGVMVGGWLDDYAAVWANRLVGNVPTAAVLEMTLVGPELVMEDGGAVALAGADLGAAVNGVAWSPGSSRWLAAGDRLHFRGVRRGFRAYLAFAGGIRVPQVLGSRSTDLVAKVGGFHGRALQSGDVVEFAGGGVFDRVAPVDTCLQGGMVRVLPGVRVDRFPPESFERLVTSIFAVSPNSDRMGLRLKGPPVTDCPISGSDISEGMAIGSVEVTPKGELLVLLKARGSIGGYPTLAHVIRADWPVLAQAKPGDAMQFEAVTLATAEQAARQRQEVD